MVWVVCAGAMVICAHAGAQPQPPFDGPGPGPGPGHHMHGPPTTTSVDPKIMLDGAKKRIDDLKLDSKQQADADKALATTRRDLDDMAAKFDRDQTPTGERFLRYIDRLRSLRWEIWDLLTPDQKLTVTDHLESMLEGPSGGERIEAVLDHLKEALQGLNLTSEQQSRIDTVLANTRKTMADLKTKAMRQGEDLKAEFKQNIDQTKQDIRSVLTQEQLNALRDNPRIGSWLSRRRFGGDRGGPPGPPPGPPPLQPPSTGPSTSLPQWIILAADNAPPPDAAPGGSLGDLKLQKLDGPSVQLSSFKGRVLVIEIGSMTCPSFRNRAAAMEQLKHEYGSKAAFALLYTREAHPTGGWEVARNQDEGVKIEQTKDDAGRRAVAKQARDTLNITLPIFVDTMDDAGMTALKISPETPNALIIIGRDGAIFYHQDWCDPAAIRRHLDDAVRPPAPAAATSASTRSTV